jgi:predicted regulator of Ras-like GTPase activity (Roadblock/LC7/MglB family)
LAAGVSISEDGTEERRVNLREVLEELRAKVRGFQGALVMDGEGVSVHQVSAQGVDVELLGAEIALILKMFQEVGRDLKFGELHHLSVLGERYQAHISCLAGGCLLGCLTASSGAFGTTRHLLQEVLPRVQAAL